MREQRDAPVDHVGCSSLFEKSEPKEVQQYQLLVSLLLSVHTQEYALKYAMNELLEHGLTVENILETDGGKILEMTAILMYSKKKVQYIKQVTEILKNDYDSRVPAALEDQLALPGVGYKIAILLSYYGFGEVRGISVDTHVHRISNRIGWVKTRQPEKTRQELESFVPKDQWPDVNTLLVGLGQQICRPLKPMCLECKASHLCQTGKEQVGNFKE